MWYILVAVFLLHTVVVKFGEVPECVYGPELGVSGPCEEPTECDS